MIRRLNQIRTGREIIDRILLSPSPGKGRGQGEGYKKRQLFLERSLVTELSRIVFTAKQAGRRFEKAAAAIRNLPRLG